MSIKSIIDKSCDFIFSKCFPLPAVFQKWTPSQRKGSGCRLASASISDAISTLVITPSQPERAPLQQRLRRWVYTKAQLQVGHLLRLLQTLQSTEVLIQGSLWRTGTDITTNHKKCFCQQFFPHLWTRVKSNRRVSFLLSCFQQYRIKNVLFWVLPELPLSQVTYSCALLCNNNSFCSSTNQSLEATLGYYSRLHVRYFSFTRAEENIQAMSRRYKTDAVMGRPPAVGIL